MDKVVRQPSREISEASSFGGFDTEFSEDDETEASELLGDIERMKDMFGSDMLTIKHMGSAYTIIVQFEIPDELTENVAVAWELDPVRPIYAEWRVSTDYFDGPPPEKNEVHVYQDKNKASKACAQLQSVLYTFICKAYKKYTSNSLLKQAIEGRLEYTVIDEDETLETNPVETTPPVTTRVPPDNGERETALGSPTQDIIDDIEEHLEPRVIELVAQLTHVGIGRTQAIQAARQIYPNSDFETAFAIASLLQDDKPSEVKSNKKPDGRKPRKASITEPASKRARSENVLPDDDDQIVVAEFADIELPKESEERFHEIPMINQGFIVQTMLYLMERVPHLADFCVICDRFHQVNKRGIMPTCCDRPLCFFQFTELNIGKDAANEVSSDCGGLALLVVLSKAAASSSRAELVFDPYPRIKTQDGRVLLEPENKNFERLCEALAAFRKDRNILMQSSRALFEEMKASKDELAYPLLCWIIASNSSSIQQIPPDIQIKRIAAEYQYHLLTAPPKRERIFREAKQQYGTVFAFHGSPVENWHAILRNGLLNLSNTKKCINGAAYGQGVYLSPSCAFSTGYSKRNAQEISVVALCEVINYPELKKASQDIWVCPNEDYVVTRMLFVFPSGSGNVSDVRSTDAEFRKEVQRVIEGSLDGSVMRRQKLKKILLSSKCNCDIATRGPPEAVPKNELLSADAIKKIMEDCVPGVDKYRYRNSSQSVIHFINSTYQNGLPQMKSLQGHTRDALQYIFARISNPTFPEREKKGHMLKLADSFTSCQAEQARAIDAIYGQLSGRTLSLREQLLALLNVHKERSLEKAALQTDSQLASGAALPHFQNSLRLQFGEEVGLGGVKAASHDPHTKSLHNDQADLAVQSFVHHFSVDDFVKDFVNDVNQPGEAERFISHDSLIKWAEPDQDNKDNVPQKNQFGFHSHWIFFNEEKSVLYPSAPTEDQRYSPFLCELIAIEILEKVFT
eukprot:m.262060 g.262060  ORF g.262060 m.262060 type:complete len:970 (+) comp16220_c0_seq24:89-2998(+)